MGNENLRWKRGLIMDIVNKAESNHMLTQSQKLENFGSGSTVFMQATRSASGLERTLTHMSTKVRTSIKQDQRYVGASTNEYSQMAEDGKSAETAGSAVPMWARLSECRAYVVWNVRIYRGVAG